MGRGREMRDVLQTETLQGCACEGEKERKGGRRIQRKTCTYRYRFRLRNTRYTSRRCLGRVMSLPDVARKVKRFIDPSLRPVSYFEILQLVRRMHDCKQGEKYVNK